ncbi:MAG TPA: hypothetical protein VMX17_16375 [Candidatus Glassbacteria bacterium]|nr:hypothetical protein [Candidatus Glassbacteria bacterium]
MKKSEVRALDNYIAGMVEKLEENKDKGGWKQNKDDWFLHKKLLEEVAEYFKSLNHPCWSELSLIMEFISAIQEADRDYIDNDKVFTKKEQKRELADIGNISMMLYDNTMRG